MPRTLSSVTTCAVAQIPLPEFACNRKRKFQCKFFFNLSSRSRHGSSSVNRSSVSSDPFRSGDVGSVSSVRMAWQGRFDAVRLVHFGHSSAVDPVRAISASSNPIDPGSVGRRSCSSPIGGQHPRSSPCPSQCPSPCLGPNQVQAQAQVYVRVQAQVYVQVEVRVQVHGQMSVASISIMFGRKFEVQVQVPCIDIPSGCPWTIRSCQLALAYTWRGM